MSTTQQQNAANKERRTQLAFGIKLHEWLVAGMLGVASGLATSAGKVHELFYDDVHDATAFENHFRGKSEEQWKDIVEKEFDPQIIEQRLKNLIKTTHFEDLPTAEEWNEQIAREKAQRLAERPIGRQERLNKVSLAEFREQYPGNEAKAGQEYRSELRKVKHAINSDFEDYALKWRGISKNPIIGTINKLETLSPRSMSRLAMNAGIGATIGAVMTVGFFNGVATRDKIDKIADKTGADRDAVASR